MPKAIIEVYFELLATNVYGQISCSFYSKFVKIISSLIHCIVIIVFVYHKLRAKIMAQRTTTANSKPKRLF